MTNPSDITVQVLAQPIAAIHAINAIDCHHLGLLDEKPLLDYLIAILAVVEALDPSADSATARYAQSAAWKRWLVENGNLDSRELVSLDRIIAHAFGTVMAFATFRNNYAAIAESALKLRSTGQTSKFSALRALPDNLEDLEEAQVDEWIQCITKLAASDSDPLVSERTRKIWCAPANQSLPHEASELRSRLGLDHLPYADDPASRTLVRLEFHKDELARECDLKRPSLFDEPGLRFRALSCADMGESCSAVNECGMTVDLDSSEYADGEAELTFLAKETASFGHWRLMAARGRLTGLHPRTGQHAEFVKHLRSNEPANSVICNYRRKSDGVRQELARLLAMCAMPKS